MPDREDYYDLSIMVGELLNEIMKETNVQSFNFNQVETAIRAEELVNEDKYWVFIARDNKSDSNVGFISLYESYALYSEGAYGTIPELFVRPDFRSNKVGELLLNKAIELSETKGWGRLEVTTPYLPAFERTLKFYQKNGFEVSGGKKLKLEINV